MASIFALMKARTSQNGFAFRVVLGMIGTNVTTLLAMTCLLLTVFLKEVRGMNSESTWFVAADVAEILLEAASLCFLATTAWFFAF
jgi:hypothetical protein